MRSLTAFLSRAWFPAALVLLLLLALPGLILLTLQLAGYGADVNPWLQETFGLSYHLALPWLPVLLLLLIPLLIVLLYFLKLKRRPLQVPSTFLWKKSIEDLHVNSLFQWLRQNILLLLQLLIVVTLIYAITGFRFHGNLSRGKHYILMIDNSASMSAKDVEEGSRLEWAKKEALKEIDAATDEDFGMVVIFNSKASTLQGYTSNRALLREAVRSIQPTQRLTRIEEALNLASSLANPVRSAEDVASRPENEGVGQERTYVEPRGTPADLFLFSDGRFPDLSEAALATLSSRQAGNTSPLGNLNLRYRRAGKASPLEVDNIGITVLNVLRQTDTFGRIGDPSQARLQVLTRVRNYRPQPATVKLNLDLLVDGKAVHTAQQTLKLSARTVTAATPDAPGKDEPGEIIQERDRAGKPLRDEPGTFLLPPLDIRTSTVIHVYLDRVNDQFALDDEAWLALGILRKTRVLRIGPPSTVLTAFFNQEAVRKLATTDLLTPADLKTESYQKAARSGEFDLVIFDRCAPARPEEMPQANTLFLDTPPPPWEKGRATLKQPVIMVSDRQHPLTRGLNTLWDIGVVEAWRFQPLESLQEAFRGLYTVNPADRGKKVLPPVKKLLEASGNAPILFTLPRGGYTDVVLTFPLLNERGDLVTNWPLQPSFPLFLRNLLYTLGNVRDEPRGETAQPGEPVVLRPEASIRTLTITPPGGPPRKLDRGNRPEFVFADTERVGIYDVLRDDQTHRAFAVNLLDAQESNIEPRHEIRIGGEVIVAGQERQAPQEIWKWVVLVALGLLLVEWYIYNRRVYV